MESLGKMIQQKSKGKTVLKKGGHLFGLQNSPMLKGGVVSNRREYSYMKVYKKKVVCNINSVVGPLIFQISGWRMQIQYQCCQCSNIYTIFFRVMMQTTIFSSEREREK